MRTDSMRQTVEKGFTRRVQSEMSWLVPPRLVPAFLASQSVRIFVRCEDFGLRWQSAAATPLFGCGQRSESGVALRFPPQSKRIWLWLRRAVFFCRRSNGRV
jgi:hypothetical protein